MIDPNGNTTTTAYNATGDPTSVTDDLGRTTTTTYNLFNEPLVTVDPLGITTTNTYDTHGNLTKKVVTADSSCTSNLWRPPRTPSVRQRPVLVTSFAGTGAK